MDSQTGPVAEHNLKTHGGHLQQLPVDLDLIGEEITTRRGLLTGLQVT